LLAEIVQSQFTVSIEFLAQEQHVSIAAIARYAVDVPATGGGMQFYQLNRRAFITLVCNAAAAWPLAVRAQEPARPVVGVLCSATPQAYASRLTAFRAGLAEVGYIENRNVAIEYRWAQGKYDLLPAMVADLLRRPVSAIVAITTPAALAAKAATTDVPIIFEMGTDPVELGLVASLNRPGGNLTGVSLLNVELASKRLELLHEFVRSERMALLVNPSNPNAEVLSQELNASARPLGVEMHVVHASSQRDFDLVFATLAQLRVDGLVIGSDPFYNVQIEQLAALTLQHRLPAIYQYREFADAGGLMSYGGNLTDPFRQAGAYTGRILKGEKPAELPVVQSTRLELIINLKTARALGRSVPLSLLGRADEVIE
jgi:putative ABC transport system substrate-binding protein